MLSSALFGLCLFLPAPARAAAGPAAQIPDQQFIQSREDVLWGIQSLKGFLDEGSPLEGKIIPMLREVWGSALEAGTVKELAPASAKLAEIKELIFLQMNPGAAQMSEADMAAAAETFQGKLKIFESLQRARVRLNPEQQKRLDEVRAMVADAHDPAALSEFYDRIRRFRPDDSPIVAASAATDLAGALERMAKSSQGLPGAQLPKGLGAFGSFLVPLPGGAASEEKIGQIAKQAGMNANIVRMVVREAKKQGVDYRLVLAVIQQESSFNPNATSWVGAKGLMQIMPGTGQGLGVRNSNDLYNPLVNIRAGIRYLKGLWERFTDFSWTQLASFDPFRVKEVKMAIAAYNAGPGAVAKYNGVPPYQETRGYVVQVLRNYVKFRRIFPGI